MDVQPGRPIRVCFVAPRAFAVLSGDPDVRHIGGAEVQQSLIAQGLLARGYGVSFVTLDHGQADGQRLGGIRVHKAYRASAGLPGLRYLHPRATGLWRAMRRADVDIYYQRTSDSLTGIVAAFCRRHGRSFVFGVGAYGDCIPSLPFCDSLRERIPYLYGLRRADAVVAQTREQQKLLQSHFGVRSIVIRSCATSAGPPPDQGGRVSPPARPKVLWMGRYSAEKRLEWLLDVAVKCPEVDFEIVGDGADDPYVRQLKSRASDIANVRMLGYLPHELAVRCYEGAAALACTSTSEGFPNVFIEAWSRGIPLVTTFDPDGVVVAHSLGSRADTPDAMAAAVRQMCGDHALRARMTNCALQYYRAHHTVEAVVGAYDQLFQRLVHTRSARLAGSTLCEESLNAGG